MKLNFKKETNKADVFAIVQNFLSENNFTIINIDESRPWGGFFVIDEDQASKFKEQFFEEQPEDKSYGKLSPKILIVASGKRLSWQYHHRRSELWKVIGGQVGIKRSNTDIEGPLEIKNVQNIISLNQGERHRLIGLESWGIVAEIWEHTDKENPSDEADIIRVQDDFGR